MSPKATIPIAGAASAGAVMLIAMLFQWRSDDPSVFAAYAVAAVVAAAVRPAWSVFSFLLLLAGCAVFSLSELLAAGAASSGIVATVRQLSKREAALDFAVRMLSTAACFAAFHVTGALPASLALATFLYLTVQGALASAADPEQPGQAFEQMLAGPFVYHLIAAAVAGAALAGGWTRNPEAWLVVAPLAYLAHFFQGLWRNATGSSSETTQTGDLPARVKVYVAVLAAVTGLLVTGAILQWSVTEGLRFAGFLTAAVIISAWKIRLPKMESAISPGFVMVLVAIAELSIAEVILIAMASVVTQSYWRAARTPLPVQVVFNASSLAVASAASFTVCRVLLPDLLETSVPLFFFLAWAVLYGGNSFMVARILSLLQQRPVTEVWRACYSWSLPYFLVGAAAAAVVSGVSRTEGWQAAMFILPLMALLSFSYRQQLTASQTVSARQ